MARNQNPEEKNLQNPVEETTDQNAPVENGENSEEKKDEATPAENESKEAEPTAPAEPEASDENLDENPAPAEEEKKEETPAEQQPKEENPVEEKPAEAPKGGKVEIKEEELKTINLLTAPEKIKKIVEFYGVTSKDLFDKDLKKFWMKKDEEKALKEWYATLA